MKSAAAFAAGLAVAAMIHAAVSAPRVSRVSLAAMEQSMDRTVESISRDDPFMLLGATRGVYLEGYGAVFTNEVDLLASAAVNPFRPAPHSKEEIAGLKQKKLARLETLRRNMRSMLVSSAASLDSVPAGEQIVLAVTIPYFRFEDAAGMPRQILMQAPRRALLDASQGRASTLDAALKVQEF